MIIRMNFPTVKLSSPEELFEARIRIIPTYLKITFLTTVISTFFIHIFFFTGVFANEDFHHYRDYTTSHIASGRWGDIIRLHGDHVLPVVLFFIFIAAMAITVCAIVALLHIRNPMSCVLISCVVPAFPSCAQSNGYLFMVEVYSIAMVCSVLAVVFTYKYRFGFLIGGILLSVSLGEYQSYLTCAMTLCAMSVVVEILRKMLERRELLKLILRYILMGLLGGILYVVILNMALSVTGTDLLNYKGISSMGRIPLSELPRLLGRTYTNFIGFFLGERFYAAGTWLLFAYAVIYVLLFVGIFNVVVRKKLYRDPLSLAALALLVGLIPCCANVIDLVAVEAAASSLNIFSFSLIVPFVFSIYEIVVQAGESAGKKCAYTPVRAMAWMLVTATVVVNWNWFIQTNLYYRKIDSYYEATVQMVNRVLSRIEVLPEFSQGFPIAFILDRNGVDYTYSWSSNYDSKIMDSPGLWDPVIGFSQTVGKAHNFIENILNIDINTATQAQINEIKSTDEYKEMKTWPTEGCIRVIDGVIVVNFVPLLAEIELQSNVILFDIKALSERVKTESEGVTYAWYVYKDGERVGTRGYEETSVYKYLVSEPGEYSGVVFYKKEDGSTVQYYTDTVEVTAVPAAVVERQGDSLVFDLEILGDRNDAALTGLTYAWYVYKNGERIETRWYEETASYEYLVSEPGEYYGLLFIKEADGTILQYFTDTVEIETVKHKN